MIISGYKPYYRFLVNLLTLQMLAGESAYPIKHTFPGCIKASGILTKSVQIFLQASRDMITPSAACMTVANLRTPPGTEMQILIINVKYSLNTTVKV